MSSTAIDKTPIYTENTDPLSRQFSHHPDVHGWGADLDPVNRPAIPKERTPPRLANVHWDKPSAQPQHVRVLHSNERPGITPIFGTSTPPSGVSGKMRELAFRFSENDMRHWLILLAADRVNVGEGLLSDLAHGHIPNLFAEMGGRAEWRHNRAGFVRKALVVSAVAAAAVYLMRRRRAEPLERD
ncbi:hypothetical protein [Caenimonas soli]|jgi:hypothetical protein|uniref:hypothetical protein n=1 Tax=Caenimonas soli TaxID=2735555 RepID=UPI001F212FF3|nr:hypothetical protein [Caenimonas soli]